MFLFFFKKKDGEKRRKNGEYLKKIPQEQRDKFAISKCIEGGGIPMSNGRKKIQSGISLIVISGVGKRFECFLCVAKCEKVSIFFNPTLKNIVKSGSFDIFFYM